MRILILVVLTLFVVNSCTKDKALFVEKNNDSNPNDTTIIDTIQPIVLPDSIFYLDIEDTVLQSFVSYNGPFSCYPVPSDSTATLKIDLTGDGIEDVIFTCRNSYNAVSGSNPCSNYTHSINCRTSSSGGILTLTNGFSMADTLSLGKNIDSLGYYYSYSSALLSDFPGYNFSWPKNKDYYVGFKIIQNNNTMYGWVLVNLGTDYNKLVVKSYAINLRLGNDITAGQTN